jgi:hypothetical protein
MESIEIRKVINGFIVVVNDEDSSKEFVFDSYRRVLKFIKEYLDADAVKK